MNIFRGYFKSNGKQSFYSPKRDTRLPKPPNDSDYVGILNPDIVQVDIDDYDDAQLSVSYNEEAKYILLLRTSDTKKLLKQLSNRFSERATILEKNDVIIVITYDNSEEKRTILRNFRKLDF